MMKRVERIEVALSEALALTHLEVLDESSGHNVPEGAESHFKVVAVSESFVGQSRINRHRLLNEILQSEFDGGMHALALHIYDPQQWLDKFGQAPMSPPCAGGEKALEQSKVLEEKTAAKNRNNQQRFNNT
jgi:BolA protein